MAGSAWIWALKGAGWLLVAATLIPFIRSDAGFVRTFDFPRLQVAVGILPVLALLLMFGRDRTGLVLLLALAACLAYQIHKIRPFTPLHAPQAVAARASDRVTAPTAAARMLRMAPGVPSGIALMT